MAATKPTIIIKGPRAVYASNSSARLNTNLLTGGGTDDTAAHQAAINRLAANGGGEYVIDGPSLVSGINLPSNIHLRGLVRGSDGLFLKAGSGRGAIRNANPIKPSVGPIVDKNIKISNLYINGNRVGGAATTVNSRAARALAESAPGIFVGALELWGIENLQMEDVEVYDAPTYGYWWANIRGGTNGNLKVRCPSVIIGSNQDGFHFNGYCYDIDNYNFYAEKTGDDSVALNASDGWDNVGAGAFPFVESGPIERLRFNGLHLKRCLMGIRSLSARAQDRLNDIFFAKLRTEVIGYSLLSDTFGVPGPGNTGAITVDGADLHGITDEPVGSYTDSSTLEPAVWVPGSKHTTAHFYIDRGKVESLRVTNVQRGGDMARSLARFTSGANVDHCAIDGVTFRDSDAAASGQVLVRTDDPSGVVRNMSINNVDWRATYAQAGSLVGNDGAIERLQINGVMLPNANLVTGLGRVREWGGSAFPVVHPGNGFAPLQRSEFNAADGTLLTAYTPDVGPAWTVTLGAFDITGGAARGTAGDNHAVIDLGTADVRLRVGHTNIVGSYGGLLVRYTDAANCVFFIFTDTTFEIYSRVANVSTVIASRPGAYRVGGGERTFLLAVRGNQIAVQTNGTAVLSATLPANLTATRHGILSYNLVGATFPSFLAERL